MKKLLEDAVVEGKKTSIRTIVDGKIKRKLPERKLLTIDEPRVYSFNYFKNKISSDFKAYCWGYKKQTK